MQDKNPHEEEKPPVLKQFPISGKADTYLLHKLIDNRKLKQPEVLANYVEQAIELEKILTALGKNYNDLIEVLKNKKIF